MTRQRAKHLSLLLACCLVLSMMTVASLADGTTTTAGSPPSGSPPSGSPPAGSPPAGAPPVGSQTGGTPPSGSPPAGSTSGGGFGITALSSLQASKYFADLRSGTAWANAYIDYAYEKGILKGVSDTVFSPGASMKRGDFVLALYRKYTFKKATATYTDVASTVYYAEAVGYGKGSGILESGDTFQPKQPVTRQQAAVWIYNCEVFKGMPADLASTDLSAYKDAASIATSARKAVATLTRLGIFSGDTSGDFRPSASLSRAEMAVIFYRLSSLGGGAGGTPPSGGTAPAGGVPGSATTDTAGSGTCATLIETDAQGITCTSTGDQENAARVDGKTVTLTDVVIEKTAGAAAAGDGSNFYGSNAGLLAMNKANVTLRNATVRTTAAGANGIFSYGSGTSVTVRGSTITTTQNSSGGVMVTGGGAMTVENCTISTKGASSAALRTDRGGGSLDVTGGTYETSGAGSPAIYCTAAISARDAVLKATGSEAVVVEGKNSVTLTNCTVSGNMVKDNVENLQNIMIYQSMSGDASTGTGRFSAEGGSIVAHNGDFIYVTNTSCEILLKQVALTLYNDVLLKVVGNDARTGWGAVGKNGGKCVMTADAQTMKGNIIVDAISTLDLVLKNGSAYTGLVNAANSGASIDVTLDAGSTWSLTGDSHLSKYTGSLSCITTNGHKLFVGGVQVK